VNKPGSPGILSRGAFQNCNILIYLNRETYIKYNLNFFENQYNKKIEFRFMQAMGL